MKQVSAAKQAQYDREAKALMFTALGMVALLLAPVLCQGHTLAAVAEMAFSGLLMFSGVLLRP